MFILRAKFDAPKCPLTNPFCVISTSNRCIVNQYTASHEQWAWSTKKPYEITMVELPLIVDGKSVARSDGEI